MGYSFVCLTDHNQATPDPGREGIVHIDSGEDGYRHRHHMCVLGINWENVRWYHDCVDPHRDVIRMALTIVILVHAGTFSLGLIM